MTVDEMQQQHDYFLMEIMDIMLGEKEPFKAPAPKKEKKKKKTEDDMFEGFVFQDI